MSMAQAMFLVSKRGVHRHEAGGGAVGSLRLSRLEHRTTQESHLRLNGLKRVKAEVGDTPADPSMTARHVLEGEGANASPMVKHGALHNTPPCVGACAVGCVQVCAAVGQAATQRARGILCTSGYLYNAMPSQTYIVACLYGHGCKR